MRSAARPRRSRQVLRRAAVLAAAKPVLQARPVVELLRGRAESRCPAGRPHCGHQHRHGHGTSASGASASTTFIGTISPGPGS